MPDLLYTVTEKNNYLLSSGLQGPPGPIGLMGQSYAIVSATATIPATTTAVNLTFTNDSYLSTGSSLQGTIEGIQGTLSKTGAQYSFTRTTAGTATGLTANVSVFYPGESKQIPLNLDNIAALRAVPVPGIAGATRRLLGYTTAGDVEMPVYRWDATSTAADNNGTIIRPTAITAGNPGRWIAIYTGDVNLKWFGAVGDGVADDTAAINNALAVLAVVRGSLFVPPGNYRTTGGHVGGRLVSGIRGSGLERSNFTHTGNNACFQFTDHLLFDVLRLESFSINNFQRQFNDNTGANAIGILAGNCGFITMSSIEVEGYVGTGGRGINLRNSREWTEDTYLENVHIRRCTNCLVLDVVAPGTTSFCSFRAVNLVMALAANQRGLWAKDGAYIYGSSFQIKGNLEGNNAIGLVFENAAAPQSFFDVMFEGNSNTQTVIRLIGGCRVLGHGRIMGWEAGDANNLARTTEPRWANIDPGSILSLDAYRGLFHVGPFPASKYYVGRLSPTNSADFVKYVIKAFAGRADNTHLGEVTYVVTSAGGALALNRYMQYGHFNGIDVRVYTSSAGATPSYEVVVDMNVTDYPWVNIRAWKYDHYGCAEMFVSNTFTPVGGVNTDVTPTIKNLQLINVDQSIAWGVPTIWGADPSTVGNLGAKISVNPGDSVFLDQRSPNGMGFRSNGVEAMRIMGNGLLRLSSLPVFADNGAAAAGGLTQGQVYRDTTGLVRVVL